MPIQYCTLPEGGDGFKWGSKGKCFATRAEAEKQAEAAYAHGYAGDTLAMDRATVRTKDVDGRLHVAVSNISKANVSPYYGKEIPDFESHGLKPDQVYNLLRDPDEIKKAVDSFNNMPLLVIHKPTVAGEHARELVVGTTGADAAFDGEYLSNSLVVWDQEGIDLIETGAQQELSCGYRYVADMTPGEYNGVKYDGRMTEIHGNHLALVEVGRAGPDVFVFDSLPLEFSKMKATRKGIALRAALTAYVRPRLAQDAAIDAKALDALIAGSKMNRPKIAAGVAAMFKGKLAQDADLEDIAEVLEVVAPLLDVAELEETALDEGGDELTALKAKLKAMLTPEQCAELGLDADPKEIKANDADPEKPDMVSKQAMDAALKKTGDDAYKRAMADAQAIRQAETDVEPLIGKIAPMASAEAVYQFALDSAKIEHEGVTGAPALRALVRQAVQHKATAQAKPVAMAQDAASRDDFAKRFPNVKFPKVA